MQHIFILEYYRLNRWMCFEVRSENRFAKGREGEQERFTEVWKIIHPQSKVILVPIVIFLHTIR